MGNVPRPNIVWRGAHPNNFTVGRPGGGLDGRNTYHHVVGSAESAVLVFNQVGRSASTHLVITDRADVQAWQCVDFANTAWGDGNWESNLRTINMEHHGDWRNGYRNAQVIENSARVVAWLRDQGLVSRPIRHRDVKQTECPAELPVEQIWNRATEIINAYNAPKDTRPQWLKDRQDVADYTVFSQIEGLRLINLNDVNQFADARVFGRNQNFLISSEVTIGGHKYLITKSSTDTNAAIGMRASEVSTTMWTPPVVVEPPKPETPKWYDSVIDTDNREMYVLRATQLINLETGRPATDKVTGKEIWYQAGDIIKDVSAHTVVNNVTYSLTEYSFGLTKTKPALANGIKQSDLTTDPKATPVGTPANPAPAPEPEDPVDPMPDVPTETVDKNVVILFLESIGKLIADFIAKLKGNK